MCSSHVSVLRFRVGQERREKDETRDAKRTTSTRRRQIGLDRDVCVSVCHPTL